MFDLKTKIGNLGGLFKINNDAWSHVTARLREAWQAVTTAEMREHYLRSMAEGISNLPEAEGLPFGDEEFDCMVLKEWVERLSEIVEMH